MSAAVLEPLQSIDLADLITVTGAGEIRWGHAAAQGAIWGLGTAGATAVTGVGAPLSLAAGAIGGATGFISSVVSDWWS
jgi:hypothetical protein